jgi:hypothetical protein
MPYRDDNKYNHRNFVVTAEALPWQQIPGNSPEEKRDFLQKQIADLTAKGDYNAAQIYSLAMPEMPGSIRSSLPEELKDARKQYDLLVKEKQAAAEIVGAFQGDLGRIIERGLEILQQKYVPQLASYLPYQRKNDTHIDALKTVDDPGHIDEVRKVIAQDREAALGQMRARFLNLKEQLVAMYQIDDVEFVHLLGATTIKGYDKVGGGDIGSFTSQRVPNANDQKTIFNMIKSVVADINNKNQTAIGKVWSGLDTSEAAKKLWPTPQPLTKENVLSALGFVESRFPRQPSDYFEHDGKKTENKELFDNPANIERLKSIIDGGFMDGNGLALITNISARSEDFNTFCERVLFWVYRTYCGKSKPEFAALLTKIGYDHLIDKIYKEQAIPDPNPEYKSMGLNFRSGEEKLIVEVLRNEFGLQAVAYPLEIPVPQGCPTNSQMFVVDFLIPCDVLVGMDDNGHPQIQRQMVFVGEYFGFDSSKELEIPDGEVWTLPDGNVATTTEGDVTTELRGGAKTTIGEKYRVRTEWKKMVETAVAELTGNKAIHLTKKDLFNASRKNLMSQLDALSIVYNSEKCPVDDNSCAVALHTMVDHLRDGCDDPNCAARAYVHGSEYSTLVPAVSPIEAYILSALTDLKIRHAFVPAITFAEKNDYNRETLWSYLRYRNELVAQMKTLQDQYTQQMRQGNVAGPEMNELRKSILVLRKQYNNLSESPAASIYQQFQAKIDGDKGYKMREQSLSKLLEAHRNNSLNLSPLEIKQRVVRITRGVNEVTANRFNLNKFVAGSSVS